MAATATEDQIPLPLPLSRLSELVDARPQAFILGDEEMHAASLEATKFVFDLSLQQEQRARAPVADLIRSVDPYTRPQTRSQSRALAEKKSREPTLPPVKADEEIWRPTPLDALHLEGMDVDQVWAQLELRTSALCDVLNVIMEEEKPDDDEDSGTTIKDDELEAFDDDLDDDMEGVDGIDDEEFYDEEDSEDEEDEEDEDDQSDEDDGDDEDLGEDIASLRDPSDEEDEDDLSDEEAMDLDRPIRPAAGTKKTRTQQVGHPELDDGFFSLADFNAEIEEAEAKGVSKGRLGQDDEDEDEDLAEDDVELFSAVDNIGGETFEEEDLEGEAYYKDFFDPPPKKTLTKGTDRKGKAKAEQPGRKPKKASQVRFHEEVKVKRIKSRGKALSLKDAMMGDDEDEDDEFGEEFDEAQMGGSSEDEEDMEDGEEEDAEIESLEDGTDETDEDEADENRGRETIERLKDDLFAEDEEGDKPSKGLSTYEARQAEIAAQIAELEAQNVGPKDWTLMGEANTRSRPINSLLEEDLEFDRVMKPVPVVTEEVVKSLEDLIKRRILDNNFDDVVRQRPADDKPFLPSRFFELNDQKSAKSLAEIYENEYTAAVAGTSVDDRDGKLKKEHEEVEKIWENICHKLDALSNAHFTPKAPKATIATVSNVPVAHLESALPTTKSVATMMAPEEVFAPKTDIRAREELTPSEKKAERTKQRKLRKKASAQLAATADKFAKSQKARGSTVKREKEQALKSVVKAGKGVTVVGKQKAELKGKSRPSQAVDGKKLKL